MWDQVQGELAAETTTTMFAESKDKHKTEHEPEAGAKEEAKDEPKTVPENETKTDEVAVSDDGDKLIGVGALISDSFKSPKIALA